MVFPDVRVTLDDGGRSAGVDEDGQALLRELVRDSLHQSLLIQTAVWPGLRAKTRGSLFCPFSFPQLSVKPKAVANLLSLRPGLAAQREKRASITKSLEIQVLDVFHVIPYKTGIASMKKFDIWLFY